MTVTNGGELRRVYRASAPRASQKVLDRLDVHCRNFIALSPQSSPAPGIAAPISKLTKWPRSVTRQSHTH